MHFYGTVLGLPFVKRWGDMPAAEFQAGNLTLAVMEPTAFGQEFGRTAFRSPCRSTTSRPRASSSRPGRRVRRRDDRQRRLPPGVLQGPAGNTLDLHHRYAPKPD